MALLMYEEHRAQAPAPEGTTLKHPLFTDPQRRQRAREMILQKRGMHGGNRDR